MIGDDRTDVAAFRVLRTARESGEIHGRAIAVGPDPTMFDATGARGGRRAPALRATWPDSWCFWRRLIGP